MSTAIIILLTAFLWPILLIHCVPSHKKKKSVRKVHKRGARIHIRGDSEEDGEITAREVEDFPQAGEQLPKESEYVLLPEQTPRDRSFKSHNNRALTLIKIITSRKSDRSPGTARKKQQAKKMELRETKEHHIILNTAEDKTSGRQAGSTPKTPMKTKSSPSPSADTPKKRGSEYLASQRDDDTLRCVKSIQN